MIFGYSSRIDFEDFKNNLWKPATEFCVRLKGKDSVLTWWTEPCSKEISNHGAHNQRGMVRLAVRFKRFVWIEDLVRMVECAASCEVYSVLKRPDEKYVTERAYENPKFVEDVVRDIAYDLKQDSNICWFLVDVENFESIHNHSAYACIERSR
jgi:GTP cyclohydrolase I